MWTLSLHHKLSANIRQLLNQEYDNFYRQDPPPLYNFVCSDITRSIQFGIAIQPTIITDSMPFRGFRTQNVSGTFECKCKCSFSEKKNNMYMYVLSIYVHATFIALHVWSVLASYVWPY